MPYKNLATQREYQRKWMAARRAEYFDGKVCVDCGTDQDLELDHVNPAEKVSHRIWSWRDEKRFAELAKCVPRCRDCHFEKSFKEGDLCIDYVHQHGTNSMYRRHGCRCVECQAWHAMRIKRWRANKRQRELQVA